MKKNNVVNMGTSSRGQRQPRGGGRCPPERIHLQPVLKYGQLTSTDVKKEPELLGWLIYRPDTKEFFHSHKSFGGYSANAYVMEPSLGFCFDTEQLAFRFSVFIDKPTEIVQLFDMGDKLAVVFDRQPVQ